MNLMKIAFKSIRQRALASTLTALSVALGVMLMVAVLVIFGLVEGIFSQRSIGYDLIVGPKGSDLQLVLNTVYRVSQSMEPLPYRYYRELKQDPRIKSAVPIAMGDVTQKGGFPIVGTVPEYFATEYMPGKKYLAQNYLRGPWDAMIGARVARVNNWGVGDKIKLVHGGTEDHVHDEEFTIVGVLKPTGTADDKTVFVHLDGFFQITGHEKPLSEAVARERAFFGDSAAGTVEEHDDAEDAHPDESHGHGHDHGHHHDIPDVQKEVSAILVQTKYPAQGVLLRAEINEGIQAQAVNPIQPMRKLMQDVVGNIRTALIVMTGLIIVVSGVSIFVSIYNSMADRRREIAIMRALGARRQTVFSIILAESILLCLGGGILGLILGHGLVFIASPIVEAKSGLLIDPLAFEPLELVLFPILLILASLVGFVPGMTAYRTDVATALSE